MKMVEHTLLGIVIERPVPTGTNPQNMCLDKGYDYPCIENLVRDWGYVAHIKARGVEIEEKKNIPGFRARRWVVERTHSWMNRFRRLLVRWEKKVENYYGMLCLACGLISFNAVRLSG